MHFDTILKEALMDVATRAVRHLTGHDIASWRNVELPVAENKRVDLLGDLPDGGMLHVELHTANEDIRRRMLGYLVRIWESQGRLPDAQVVLYIGRTPATMPTQVVRDGMLTYQFNLVDIRDLDAEPLLDSPHVRDNVIAVLLNLRDPAGATRRILARIADLDSDTRRAELFRLLTLAGLRPWAGTVREEIMQMTELLDFDIMEHGIFGPMILEGMEKGREEGREEAREEGREEAREEARRHELAMARRVLERRFHSVPEWVEKRLTLMSTGEIEDVMVGAVDAARLEDLFA